MATLFKLPLLGQTMQEGTILKWFKQEGEKLQGWESLFEVMTDKVNMEVEPQVSGVLRKILAPEGTTVPVGAPVAIIGTPDEPIDDLLASLGPATTGDGATGDDSGNGSSAASPDSARRAGAIAPERSEADRGESEPPPISPRARHRAEEASLNWRALTIEGSGYEGMIVERDIEAALKQLAAPPRLTPLAARLAAQLGVDASALSGTGPGGKITADDVRRAASIAAPPTAPASEARPPQVIPITGVRKRIADRLQAIYQAAPHVPLRVEIDMTEAAALRAQLLPEIERQAGVRLTYTDLIAAAVIAALRDHPRLNATLEDDRLLLHPAVHLGIAVALDDGLLVPVLRDADRLRLSELAARAKELAERARSGKITPDELSGGTFTITNLGAYGVESFDPILNPPQVAILGVGRITERLVPHGDGVAARQRMSATLVFDHRALDGAPAARFLARIKELLEAPARILV